MPIHQTHPSLSLQKLKVLDHILGFESKINKRGNTPEQDLFPRINKSQR